jgi:toxin-antitoxin system PIN domain toxin
LNKRSILADVNIWLATLVEQHPHHRIAVQWWQREVIPDNKTVVFCRITQLGLLRLLTNEKVMGPQRRSLEQAFSDYSQLLEQEIVNYADEPGGLEQKLKSYCNLGRQSRNFWTDAYLAAFACCADSILVTFDRGFRLFPELDLRLLGEPGE